MKASRQLVIGFIFVSVFASINTAKIEVQTKKLGAVEVGTWIEENIPLYMERARMPGFSIAVVKDGKTIYAGGFGLRDTQKVLPATPDTLYGIGSITKSFVAIGIMQLVEAGELRLDDPVSKHIPFEFGLLDEPITIHHLLTHSPGIPSLATVDFYVLRNSLKSPVEFVAREDCQIDLFIGRYCYHKVD